MIVYKNKGYEIRQDKPNENWTKEECFVVEDGSELANKIVNAYPNYNFIIKNGELIDIEILEESVITQEPAIEDYLLDLDFRVSKIELGLEV